MQKPISQFEQQPHQNPHGMFDETYPPVKRDDARMIAMLEDIQRRLSRIEAILLPHPGSAGSGGAR